MEDEAFGGEGLGAHGADDGDKDPNDKRGAGGGSRTEGGGDGEEFVEREEEAEEDGDEDSSDGVGGDLPEEDAADDGCAEGEKEEVGEFAVEFDATEEIAEDDKGEDETGEGEGVEKEGGDALVGEFFGSDASDADEFEITALAIIVSREDGAEREQDVEGAGDGDPEADGGAVGGVDGRADGGDEGEAGAEPEEDDFKPATAEALAQFFDEDGVHPVRPFAGDGSIGVQGALGWEVEAGEGRRGLEAAHHVDEGVFELAFDAMEFGEGEAVGDHLSEQDGEGFIIACGEFEAGSVAAFVEEFDAWAEGEPVEERGGVAGEGDVDDLDGGGESVGGGLVAAAELFGGAMVDDFAGVDEEEGVAHFAEFGEDVGGDEEGFALLGEDADEVLEFDAGFGVEAGGRFVEDEELGVWEEHAAKAEALAHAFAEFVDGAVGEGGEVGEVEDLFDAGAALGAAEAVGAGEEVEVFEDVHVGVGSVVVGHPADDLADGGGFANDVMAGDADAAAAGSLEGSHHAPGGGFAGAVGTDETDDLAGKDVERDAFDGVDLGEAAVEVADFDDGFWGGHFWGGRGEEFDRISGLTGFHSLCWLFEG